MLFGAGSGSAAARSCVAAQLRRHRALVALFGQRRTATGHVARVTIIPLQTDTRKLAEEEDAEVAAASPSLLQRLATTAPERRATLLAALPQIGPGREDAQLSRTAFLEAFETLRCLQLELCVPPAELDIYWEALGEVSRDQFQVLLAGDVAESFRTLAACDRRCPAVTQQLSLQCRRLYRSLHADDIGRIAWAIGRMGFRSSKMLALLRKRLVQLLQDPEGSSEVHAKNLVAMAATHAKLRFAWKDQKSEHLQLDFWKAIAVAVPSRRQQMTPKHFELLLNSYANMDFAFSAIHKNVAHMFETCANHLAARIAAATPTTNVLSGSDLSAAEKGSSSDYFEARQLALIANAYARVRAGPFCQPLMQTIAARATLELELERGNGQDVANILNACAKLEVASPPLFEAAGVFITQHVTALSPQGLANCAHAYARLEIRHEAAFGRMAELSLRLLDKFDPQMLGIFAWAYGRLRIKHEALVHSLRDEVIYRATVGRSLQESSNIYRFRLSAVEQLAQAFARFAFYDQRLFFVLFDMARQRVREFLQKVESAGEGNENSEQLPKLQIDAAKAVREASRGDTSVHDIPSGRGLTTLLSAFSKSRSDFHALLRWIPKQVMALQGQYSTSQLAVIFNSCTRLGIRNRPLYYELLGHSKLRIPQMRPATLAALVRALARTKLYNRVVMRQIVKTISPQIVDLGTTDVCALLVGCAEIAYRDERFLRLLASVVRSKIDELSSSELANAFASFSQMRILHYQWFDEILFELFRRQHELTEKDATNVAYAMALVSAAEIYDGRGTVGGRRQTSFGNVNDNGDRPPVGDGQPSYPFDAHRGVLQSMLNITNRHRHELTYSAIFQLQILELFLRLMSPGTYEQLHYGTKLLLAKARKVSIVVDDYMQSSSKMHRRISRFFTKVGLHHRSEVHLGPFMLDMVIGDRLVIEVDGPSHFYRDTNSRTVTSIFKRSILTALGFHVRHVPYQEWHQCGTYDKRILYCSSFWRDLLGVQQQIGANLATGQEDMASRLSSEKTLPLVDIVEMVMKPLGEERLESPSADICDKALPGIANEEAGVSLKAEPSTGLPAFYSLDSDDDENDDNRSDRHAMIPKEERMHSIDANVLEVESVGARSVDEILAAHQEAERQLAADRQQEISARQRLKLESRSRLDEVAANSDLGVIDEWEKARSGSRSKSAADVRTQDDLRKLLPRSKRRLVRHSGGGFFDYDALELSTDDDSSDGEQEADGDQDSKATSARTVQHRHGVQERVAAAHETPLGFVERPLD